MKKIILTILTISIFASHSWATENYLLLRHQNQNQKNGSIITGTYNVFENNKLENWALGFRIISGANNFKLFSPHIFYKGFGSLQPGIKYTDDSFGNRRLAPALRYKGTVWDNKLFTIIDTGYYLGLNNEKDIFDLWINLVTTGAGWYLGSELHLHHKDKTIIEARPLKIGYRFQNGFAPFVMGEMKYQEGKHVSDSLYLGCEITF